VTFRVHVDSTFVRSELHFSVRCVDEGDRWATGTPDEREPSRWKALCDVLDETERPVIVYAPRQLLCKELASLIESRLGVPALAYHAGLEPDVRRERERLFLGGDVDVIVATNAFGMGVDKADVRTVVHWSCPPSPEALYQEAGRAGRGAEGQPAQAILLFNPSDLDDAYRLVRRDSPTAGETRRTDVLLRELADHAQSDIVNVADVDVTSMANLRERVQPRVVLAHLERAGLMRELQRFGGARLYVQVGPPPDDLSAIERIIEAILSNGDGPQTVIATEVLDVADHDVGLADVHAALRSLERRGVIRQVRQLSVALLAENFDLVDTCRQDSRILWRALEAHHKKNGASRYLYDADDVLGDSAGALRAIETLACFGLIQSVPESDLSETVPGVRAVRSPNLGRMRRAFDVADALYRSVPPERTTHDLAVLASVSGASDDEVLDGLTILYLVGCASVDLKRWSDGQSGPVRRLQLLASPDRDAALAAAEEAANHRTRESLLRLEVLRRYARLDAAPDQDVHQAFLHRYLSEPDFMESVADDSAAAALHGLSATQRAIVRADSQDDLVVVAGPGTGKTRTLVRRVAYRTRSARVLPDRVLALTFTRAAVEELKVRLGQLAVRGVDVRTIDSLSREIALSNWRALGYSKEPEVLADDNRRSALLRRLEVDDPRRALQDVDRARAGSASTGNDDLVRRYVGELRRTNTIDFPQALLDAIVVLNERRVAQRFRDRFDEIIVDEFQDVSTPQANLVMKLTGRHLPDRPGAHLTLVGDPRQTIYEWRGARQDLLLRMRDAPGTQTFDLVENHRSDRRIVDLGNRVVAAVLPDLPPVEAVSEADGVAVRRATRSEDEMLDAVAERVQGWIDEGVPDADIAVLAFRGQTVTKARQRLHGAGIVAHDAGLQAISKTNMFQLVRRLAAQTPWFDDATVTDAVNTIERTVLGGDTTDADRDDWDRLAVELLVYATRPAADVVDTLDDLARRDDGPTSTAGVTVTTLHKAKGLEWEAVAITDAEAGPGLDGPLPEDERCRLLFVGITRAKKYLHVSYAGRPSAWLPEPDRGRRAR
jgi:DNA helicase-2/ATP-dependent DNA helicase PcrA